MSIVTLALQFVVLFCVLYAIRKSKAMRDLVEAQNKRIDVLQSRIDALSRSIR